MKKKIQETKSVQVVIPNHYAPKLSELDIMTAKAVPPGGNWKNVPDTVPSKRLESIRKSFAAGEGSRSTYYGRLTKDAPAYTINTYFGRPGNGCHLHYDYAGEQHRTISQREAARLQSFPDSFVFHGSKTSINQQIGNAVPPLLAYQIAKCIPHKGQFIDLFSGAGGLALGFIWAGWKPIVANDIERHFLKTFSENIHSNVIEGDIQDDAVIEQLVSNIRKKRDKDLPLWVLGGPPCQGFSTAGKKRSMEDERNWLFKKYEEVLSLIKPDGFLFENVTGILNMQGGQVFNMVKDTLSNHTDQLHVWKLQAEKYGVPQRRTRVILIGDNSKSVKDEPPPIITEFHRDPSLYGDIPKPPSVEEALSDLPSITSGEDGSDKEYICEPATPYQMLMRGYIKADEYIKMMKNK